MAMTKKTKTTLLLVGLAIGAYLIYRWYENKSSTNSSGTGTGLGSNLNSTLTSLNAGPQTNVYLTGTNTVSSGSAVTQPARRGQHAANSAANSSATGSGTSGTANPGTPATTTSTSGAATSGSTPLPAPFVGTGGQLISTVSQFLAYFKSSGTNAGQLVQGATGPPPGVKPVT
jgi:hypothetical protein